MSQPHVMKTDKQREGSRNVKVNEKSQKTYD